MSEPTPPHDPDIVPSPSRPCSPAHAPSSDREPDQEATANRTAAPDGPPPSGHIPNPSRLEPAKDGSVTTGRADATAPHVPGTGIDALSFRYQVLAALALAVAVVAVLTHLAMVFLHVAPSNTLTQQHGKVVNDWILPEFEQNWKLFAPNPLQSNIAVQVRAEVRTASGTSRSTGWYDLSARDGAAIDHNPAPSHTTQNELRRAWDFFTSSHDDQNRPIGLRGELSESYLRRILVLRLHQIDQETPKDGHGVVERVQVRSVTTGVKPPRWTGTQSDTKPVYRTLPWWSVNDGDRPLGLATATARPKDTAMKAEAR